MTKAWRTALGARSLPRSQTGPRMACMWDRSKEHCKGVENVVALVSNGAGETGHPCTRKNKQMNKQEPGATPHTLLTQNGQQI